MIWQYQLSVLKEKEPHHDPLKNHRTSPFQISMWSPPKIQGCVPNKVSFPVTISSPINFSADERTHGDMLQQPEINSRSLSGFYMSY